MSLQWTFLICNAMEFAFATWGCGHFSGHTHAVKLRLYATGLIAQKATREPVLFVQHTHIPSLHSVSDIIAAVQPVLLSSMPTWLLDYLSSVKFPKVRRNSFSTEAISLWKKS